MAVVLSMIAKGLYIIGGVTVFFAILCLSTLNCLLYTSDAADDTR